MAAADANNSVLPSAVAIGATAICAVRAAATASDAAGASLAAAAFRTAVAAAVRAHRELQSIGKYPENPNEKVTDKMASRRSRRKSHTAVAPTRLGKSQEVDMGLLTATQFFDISDENDQSHGESLETSTCASIIEGAASSHAELVSSKSGEIQISNVSEETTREPEQETSPVKCLVQMTHGKDLNEMFSKFDDILMSKVRIARGLG